MVEAKRWSGLALAVLMVAGTGTVLLSPGAMAPHTTNPFTSSVAVTGANDQTNADIALGPRGEIYVVWEEEITGVNHDVYFSRSLDGGQTFSTPIRVDDQPPDEELWDPAMAVGPEGNIYVVWTDYRFVNEDIYFSRSTNGGVSFQTPLPLASSGSDESRPAIAVGPEGNVYVVYDGPAGGAGRQIYSIRSTNGGTSFDTAVLVQDAFNAFHGNADVAVDSGGWVHVVWETNWAVLFGSTGWDIYYSRSRDLGMTWDVTYFRVTHDTVADEQRNPAIAITESGATITVTAYFEDNGGTVPWDIRYSQSADRGVFWTGDTTITDDSPGFGASQANPAAAAGGGTRVVAWEDNREPTSSWDIFLDHTGGSDIRVNDDPTGTALNPSLAMDADRSIYVVWQDDRNSATSGLDIFFAKMDITDPEPPTNVEATSNTAGTAVTITWSASTSLDVVNYVIRWWDPATDEYRDLATVGSTVFTYTHAGTTPETSYSYQVVAVDDAGNEASNYPYVFTNVDSDGDGTANADDLDDDGDGYPDGMEGAFGTDSLDSASKPADADGDRIPDAWDEDDDGDGYSDAVELGLGTNPTDSSSKPLDTDGDKIPDAWDEDDDGDGTPDVQETAATASTFGLDTILLIIVLVLVLVGIVLMMMGRKKPTEAAPAPSPAMPPAAPPTMLPPGTPPGGYPPPPGR